MKPEEAAAIIDRLLDGWEGALHNVDSLWQIVQHAPNWKEDFRAAFDNPLRIQSTKDRFAPVRQTVEAVRQGGGLEAVQRIFEAAKRGPN